MQEGCRIKLKMGKKGNESAEQPDSESAEQPKSEPETPENVEEEKKEDVEKLRKVIKVDDGKEEKKKEDAPKQEETGEEPNLEDASREGLEQKRAILQSIKDFDFQIKKNQEEITAVNTKLDAVSKDLDDLVSLYEIVSEQMNPFVGLSKVTKKRLDALETFTKEIDDLKNRVGDIESFAVRSGADLKTIGQEKQKELQNPEILEGDLESQETFIPEMEGVEPAVNMPKSADKEEAQTESDKEIKELTEKEIKVEIESIKEEEKTVEKPVTTTATEIPKTNFNTYADSDIDVILDKALSAMSLDYKIDRFLDEFIESLKA